MPGEVSSLKFKSVGEFREARKRNRQDFSARAAVRSGRADPINSPKKFTKKGGIRKRPAA